jgi:hypothetical protein
MGYTHYWRINEPIPAVVFKDAQKIIAKATELGIVVCGADGTGLPTIDESGLKLNGDRSQGLSHETFELSEPTSFDFCKTAEKPYDTVVGAILISLKKHLPSADITSDGGWFDEEWSDPRVLYLCAFGTVALNPLSND